MVTVLSFLLRKKSDDLLIACRKACRELNMPAAYKACIESIEVDPANLAAITLFKTLIPIVSIGYNENFDLQRAVRAVEKCISIYPTNPLLWFINGMLQKLQGNIGFVEESLFRAVFLNRNIKDVQNQAQYLFELAYTYKNQGLTDIFSRMTLSVGWNMNLFSRTGRVALPKELLDRRLVGMDFSIPPALAIRHDMQNRGKFYMLYSPRELPEKAVFKNYIKTLKDQKIDFSLLHIIPDDYLTKDEMETTQQRGRSIRDCLDCPISVYIKGYSIVVCPLMKEIIGPLLEPIDGFWTVKMEKKYYCHCR